MQVVLIDQFNALLAWADAHQHAAFPGAPSTLASATVKKVTDERVLGPKGVALSGTVTNTLAARNFSGPTMSMTEFTLSERLWERMNAIRDSLDIHSHAAINTVPSTLLAQAITNENGRDPNGKLYSAGTLYKIRFFMQTPGPENDALDELIVQFNNFCIWFDLHQHTAINTNANPTMAATAVPVSKIADLQGYNLAGTLLVP